MRVAIAGAGPAGLYAAILLRRKRPDIEIRLVEQNPANATFGFGVVFSDTALEFLRGDDPETCDLIAPAMERWSDIQIVHRGERVRIDGVGFSAIGRLELLQFLHQRARDAGIEPEFETRIEAIEELGPADLVIGADGLNSVVRAMDGNPFGEHIEQRANHFVWYGADRSFDYLTQTFIETEHGPFNAHHYRYTSDASTFLIECGPQTWRRAGFESKSAEASRLACEALFAQTLDGASLIDNHSLWRTFPQLRSDRWYVGNRVLVGDALHTAHFSIGSGTRLALEDVAALVKALEAHQWEVAAALPAYEAARRPVLEKLLHAADRSAAWYERFAEHMALDPWRFALSYIQRTGRVDGPRLTRFAPRFAAALGERGLLPPGR